jgi:hypothetical protein
VILLEALCLFSNVPPISIPTIEEKDNLAETPQVKSVEKVKLCSSCIDSVNSKLYSKELFLLLS